MIWAKIRSLRERYKVQVVRTTFVLAAAAVVVAWVVPPVKGVLIDRGVIQLIILGLAADVTITVARLISVDYKVGVIRDDCESEEHLMKHLQGAHPKRADLIGFSGYSIHQVIEQLAHGGARVRLLLKDPRTVGEFQRRRILASVEHIQKWIIDRYDVRIEIRFYSPGFSLRGLKLDDRFISVGWYTPAIGLNGEDEGAEVQGHCNPSIMCSVTTDEGQRLRAFFDATFTSLWNASKNNTLKAIHADATSYSP